MWYPLLISLVSTPIGPGTPIRYGTPINPCNTLSHQPWYIFIKPGTHPHQIWYPFSHQTVGIWMIASSQWGCSFYLCLWEGKHMLFLLRDTDMFIHYILYWNRRELQNKIYFMTNIVKGISFKCFLFCIGHGIHSNQTWYSPSDMVPTIKPGTSLSNQTLYPMDLVTFLPLDLVPPIGIRMTAPSHEVVIPTYGHWQRSTYFSN